MSEKRQYTWKKQIEDSRDFKFSRLAAANNFSLTLPKSVNNRVYCPAVFDQSSLGSCTANAWSGLLGYNQCKSGKGGKRYRDRSRLFIYYNERVLENTVNEDSGASLRSGAKSIANLGVCNEGDWKYNISKFTVKPTNGCYKVALTNVIHSYYSLRTLTEMKTALANGQCFVFGFAVFSGFESEEMANTGILQMPTDSEEYLGGHAVMAVGFEDATQRILVRNSWGTNWGMQGNMRGYFTMPYSYISNSALAGDFWTVAISG